MELLSLRNKFRSIITLDVINRTLLFLLAVIVITSQILILLKQNETLRRVESLTIDNQKTIESIQKDNQEQHNRLIKQIQCLARVSIVAAAGNDITIQNLEECKYKVVPQQAAEPQIIIQEIVRTETITVPAPQPEQPGKGKKK